MAFKHQKSEYILVDESSADATVKLPKAAHARVVLPEIFEAQEEPIEEEPVEEEPVEEEPVEEELEDEPVEEVSAEEELFDQSFFEEEPQDEEAIPEEDAPEDEGYDAADNMNDEAFEGEEFLSSEEQDAPKSHKGLKVAGIVLGAIAGVAAVAYVAGALFFGSHFLPGTTINGMDVSLKTQEDVQPQLVTSLEDYALEVSGYGYGVTISGEDISYGLDANQDMFASFNQWAWPADLIQGKSSAVELQVSYDTEALETILDESLDAHNEEASSPKDAHLAYDEKTDAIVVAAETQGTRLNTSQVKESVKAALNVASRKLELGQQDLVQPGVLSTDESLKKAATQVNQISNVNVTMTLGGYDAIKINKGTLLNWVITDDNRNVVLNEAAVKQWAEQTAQKLNTYGTEHTYTRPDGKEITVECEEAFGWSIDTEALADEIVRAVREGAQGTIEIPCDHEGAYYNMETGAEWTRYVDVDLDEQHAYFYNDKNELIWESDIISGNVNYPSRQTPTGVFSIQRKATNERLYTYEEGSSEPSVSVVAYWMPFVGNLYALHDAWWQPDFGGTMYRDGYGSHGCVNLPTDAAADIYDLIEVGDVVVVHW